MTLLLDTGAAYAYYDRDDSWHAAMRQLIDDEAGTLALPAIVIPEVDHLLGTASATRRSARSTTTSSRACISSLTWTSTATTGYLS